MRPRLLHIPKTGGHAIRYALSGQADVVTHLHRLSDIPEDCRVAIFVRDPVARFVSLHDCNSAHSRTWRDRFPHIDDAAFALGRTDDLVVPPMTWWFDDDPERAFVGRTEHLAADLALLCRVWHIEPRRLPRAGDPRRHHHVHRTRIGPVAEQHVRDYFADDYALLSELAIGKH